MPRIISYVPRISSPQVRRKLLLTDSKLCSNPPSIHSILPLHCWDGGHTQESSPQILSAGFSKSTRTQEQRISKARPYLAEVVAVEGLCQIQDADDKDTIRVEMDISGSGLEYLPGDALGIHASNAPQVNPPPLPRPPPPPADMDPARYMKKPTLPHTHTSILLRPANPTFGFQW